MDLMEVSEGRTKGNLGLEVVWTAESLKAHSNSVRKVVLLSLFTDKKMEMQSNSVTCSKSYNGAEIQI